MTALLEFINLRLLKFYIPGHHLGPVGQCIIQVNTCDPLSILAVMNILEKSAKDIARIVISQKFCFVYYIRVLYMSSYHY